MPKRRPPAPVRVMVLLLALTALFCAVCARSGPSARPPAAQAPDAGVPQDVYFPATKAPAQLYLP